METADGEFTEMIIELPLSKPDVAVEEELALPEDYDDDSDDYDDYDDE